MKKALFNIATVNGIFSIPGYVFYYGNQRYGVTQHYLWNGQPEKGFTWTITELTTGMSIGIAAETRKAAIDKLVKSLLPGRVAAAVAAYKGPDVNAGVMPDTQFLTVYTA